MPADWCSYHGLTSVNTRRGCHSHTIHMSTLVPLKPFRTYLSVLWKSIAEVRLQFVQALCRSASSKRKCQRNTVCGPHHRGQNKPQTVENRIASYIIIYSAGYTSKYSYNSAHLNGWQCEHLQKLEAVVGCSACLPCCTR